ncbi:hypothetical protein IAI10_19020 [Clostridium sp. 19966]|uniref:hypothetical protein n=1 Tax=Clostridium sp. 19966 TaxID=2768166 RepID=UPI0028DD7E52|nr:hypothetical protein [Clostridium sp. 19966]MDT8718754.1 hypothetical protein [Clostridium sp. 19966]
MNKKYIKKLITSLILLFFIMTVLLEVMKTKVNEANIKITAEDKQIAEKISNMTGIKTDKIEKLKAESSNWNEVLNKLKGNEYKLADNKSSNLDKGLDSSELLENLTKQGYSDKEILEAKMLVERVEEQLNDITQQDGNKDITEDFTDENAKTEEDTNQYIELLKKYKAEAAVVFLLKLKSDFGTEEKVLDEYLYSLQLDLDLNLYITDKKQYEKEKEDKNSEVDTNKIITLEKIEAKQLEIIQKQNKKSSTEIFNSEKNSNSQIKDSKDNSNPENEKKVVSPVTNDVMNEINDLNKNVLNQDGR